MEEVDFLVTGLDLNTLEPTDHRHTLASINDFISNTSSFLNHFSSVCEEKLSEVSFRLQRLQITTAILEDKLSSIQGLKDVTGQTYVSTTETPVIEQKQSQQRPQQQPQSQPQQQQLQESQQTQQQHQEVVTEQSQTHQNAESSQTNTAAPMIAKKNHPTLKRYFNMMTYGVPPGAVRTKFVAETGLDPVLLDDPDALIDESMLVKKGSSEADDKDDDFSDDDDDETVNRSRTSSGSSSVTSSSSEDDMSSDHEFSD
eukprot:gene5612-192_t